MELEPITHLEKSIAGTVAPVTHLEKVIEQYGGGGGGGGAVSSVNGKTGTVVLNAEDVGALPDDTPIPAAVTEQTVSGWGFTKNAGTYSKPASGIPETDLASAVQTSLLPVVSSSDNDKFLRVVSGAWAAATVPSAETTNF